MAFPSRLSKDLYVLLDAIVSRAIIGAVIEMNFGPTYLFGKVHYGTDELQTVDR